MPESVITGENIVLRPLTKADIENRVKWFNDPDVRKTLIINERFELEKTIKWFEKIQSDDSRLELTGRINLRRYISLSAKRNSGAKV